MKLLFSIIFLLFLTFDINSQELEGFYILKTKGIKIGELRWLLNMDENSFESSIKLESKGLFSNMYNFKGNYKTKGSFNKNGFSSKIYEQVWLTKKKQREVTLNFKKNKIEKLTLKPEEKEYSRINILNLVNHNDPITSFMNNIFYKKPSYTIDGRRVYELVPKNKNNAIFIFIENYKNIWADHKRNDLEYLEVFLSSKMGLPEKINIMFNGSVFSLIRE